MYFDYKNVKINYTVSGEGKTYILFLHGWGGSTYSFLGHERLFCKNYTCINADFPPFGQSSKLFEPWDVATYADMIMSLLKHLGIAKTHVVAHSFGARIAIILAGTNVVDKLIITGGAGVKSKKTLKKQFRIWRYKVCKQLVKWKLLNKNVLKKFGSIEYKQLDAIEKQTFVNIVNFDERQILGNIKCKTLLVWGSDDEDTPMYMAKIFKRRIKGSELIVFKGCTHYAYIQEFNRFYKIAEKFLGE